MEKGEMRCEVNLSLHKKNEKLGTKVEIKNLNSFRAVEKGIEYEIKRQKEILNDGGKIIQETRGWNNIKGITVSQREKEQAHDYRYFPEPDLPPLRITKEIINKIRAEVPELPFQKRERFKKEYQLDKESIEVFVRNKDFSEYFEKAMSELRNWVKEIELKKKVEEKEFFKLAKICSNYLITDLQGLLKNAPIRGEDFLITPENFAEFITLIYMGKISSKIAKIVLREMFGTGADPSHIIKQKGLIQITDKDEIKEIIKEVISKNQKAVEDYKKGKTAASQFLIGEIMRATKGKADPGIVQKILKEKLFKN
jgi:aspartyl-tRNA(Asn)/glutamyl-tRNA(Gln) amidotransferase subunit B